MNRVKNNPKLPASMPRSTHVGRYVHQLDGRKSRVSDVTMITNRSNHIPELANVAMMNTNHRFVRSRFDHMNCGAITLQDTIVQNVHANGPSARFMNVNCSYRLPLYQAMKNSIEYE